MGSCLYASDYGPPDPGFDPAGSGGALLRGFEAHGAVLMTARNLGQLEAMQRAILHDQPVRWCDQGYAWAETPWVQLGMVLLFVGTLARGLARMRQGRSRAPRRGAPFRRSTGRRLDFSGGTGTNAARSADPQPE